MTAAIETVPHNVAIASDNERRISEALSVALRELTEFVAGLSDTQYRAEAVGHFAGSIGAHVRHSLDHLQAVVAGLEKGVVEYDRRERGTAIEKERGPAMERMAQLERRVRSLSLAAMGEPLRIRTLLAAAGPVIETHSTVGRELVFALSHAIHHNAMIAIAAKHLGASLPERFGMAPATLAHLQSQACPPHHS